MKEEVGKKQNLEEMQTLKKVEENVKKIYSLKKRWHIHKIRTGCCLKKKKKRKTRAILET